MVTKPGAQPPPASANAGAGKLDLSGGMLQKDVQQSVPAEPEQSGMDQLKDTLEKWTPNMNDMYLGVLKGAGDTAHGIGSLLNKIPIVGEDLAPKQGLKAMDQMDEAHGVMQHLGKGAELVMEFMGGDELIKGLPMVEKLAHMQKVAQFMKAYPRLGAIMAQGIKNFGLTSAQGMVKDADPDKSLGDTAEQATEEGATAAGTGIVLDGALGYGRKLLSKIAPRTTTIAGETMPKLASQEHGAPALAGKVATIGTEPEIAAAQQQGTQQGIKNIARDATKRSLDTLNESRMPSIEEQELQGGPIDNFKRNMKALKGDVTIDPLQATPGELGAGTDIVPASKSLARSAAAGADAGGGSRVTKITQQVEKPANIKPADVKAAISRVHSFGDAADEIENAAKPTYQKLDELSKGEFTAMRAQRNAAKKVMLEPNSMESWSKAQDKLEEADAHIDSLFEQHKGEIDKGDWKSANSAWRDAKILDRVHTAVEGAFNGVPESVANRTGLHRGISGNKLQANLGSMLRTMPQADVERVIGKDGLDNLYRIADLTSTAERKAQFGSVTDQIAAEFLPKRGMIGGVADDARRFVLHGLATNPRAGKMVADAIKVGASPKIYAPLVAQALRSATAEPKQEE